MSNHLYGWIFSGVGILMALGCLTMPMYAGDAAEFTLAWSEYPSWSTFGVANELKLIDGAKGKKGSIEEKWNVDIVLKEADYESCLVMYASNQCDAVCITNMDALNPCLSRPSTVILPTSTSFGADACIVSKDIADVKQLRGKKIYGLAKTVSEYCFVRNLEILGEKEADYQFTNMDPAAAAMAMQQKRDGYNAIVVWNPFVLETLNKRKDAKVLFDSTTIPGEIIDMVVAAQSALDKPGGDACAHAVIDAFYAICSRMTNPATQDDTLIALGEKFSNLNLQSMRQVVKQTKFYGTAAEGIQVLSADSTKTIMQKVVDFSTSHDVIPKKPVIGYGAKGAEGTDLRLDPSYIQHVIDRAK